MNLKEIIIEELENYYIYGKYKTSPQEGIEFTFAMTEGIDSEKIANNIISKMDLQVIAARVKEGK